MSTARTPWSQRKDDEEQRREATSELYDLDWRETSFVPAGDDPEARILFWKSRPGAAELLSDEEIESVIEDVASEGRSMTTTTKFTKRSDVFAEANRRAVELQKEDPETYGDKSLAAVRSAIFAADEHLREALAALPPEEEPEVEEEPAVAQKGADVLREHAQEAAKLATDPRVLAVPEHARMAKARLLAWEKPGLRERYQKAISS